MVWLDSGSRLVDVGIEGVFDLPAFSVDLNDVVVEVRLVIGTEHEHVRRFVWTVVRWAEWSNVVDL